VHFQPLHASSAATIVFSDLPSADSHPHLSQPTLVSIRAMKPKLWAELVACMRRRRGRRTLAVDLRLIQRPRRRTALLSTPGWPVSHLGRIWPRSGEARPDPAYFFFFLCMLIDF
jgi:hypothetical protein